MNQLIKTFVRNTRLIDTTLSPQITTVRWKKAPFVKFEVPKPGQGQQFRRVVHYPEQYTIEPLPVTNLAGRDPVTGRVAAKGIGGGIKHKYHWVDWKRAGPKEGPPVTERVLEIMKCGCRTADVALVGTGDNLRYVLASSNMKIGDVIRTSGHIPRIPVRANEGDAYPLGALPLGTVIHSVERAPNTGGYYAHGAGTFCTILRRIGRNVIINLPSKIEVALNEECMAVVGRVSNILHNKTPVGSATRNRELGNRPRSGLWQRKKGCHGRKIRKPPPVRFITGAKPKPPQSIHFSEPYVI